MSVPFSLKVTLEHTEFHALWNRAVRETNFMRDNPRKAWTDKERRAAIRAWIQMKALQG